MNEEKLQDILKDILPYNITVFIDEWNTEVDIDYKTIAKSLIAHGIITEENNAEK